MRIENLVGDYPGLSEVVCTCCPVADLNKVSDQTCLLRRGAVAGLMEALSLAEYYSRICPDSNQCRIAIQPHNEGGIKYQMARVSKAVARNDDNL